ncbi:ABC transporter permease [Cohnella caldifontis]|uniref:ABC transporter permease n=1 Tax=Cohnella caldifontis TaxID=3027471 RepID=UPI0023EDA0EA|nr:ABC transporter permease subunit [Cohnella sp. YIM B05605]
MNKTLLAGLLITLVIVAASLFGRYFAPHDLSEHVEIEYVVDENGKGTLLVPPVPPGAEHPFGTDKAGYDMMAKMLAGSHYTIFLSLAVAFCRVAVGGMLGLLLGTFAKERKTRTNRASVGNLLNGIPMFILVWMILVGISINPSASNLEMALLLAAVLTIVGIPPLVFTMREKTMVEMDKPFVLSAIALGADRWRVIRTHLVPHMKESFAIAFVQEIVLVAGLFGSLAIFDIFVGGTTMNRDPVEYISRTNEWGGLIAQARDHLYARQWLLLIPLAAYVLYILGMHLISVGLEKSYKERFRKVSHV